MINLITEAASLVAGRWRWRKARSLTDLANLQADRIARNLAEMTDAEIGSNGSMYSALIALGRAGFVVTDWRPGTYTTYKRPDGTGGFGDLETRACVTFFADADEVAKNRLEDLLYYAGKEPGAVKYEFASVFELYAPGCLEYDRSGGADGGRNRGRVWCERIDGEVTVRFGGQLNAKQLYRAFPTRSSVQQELRRAWQITICSPEWGNGRMWVDLLRLLPDDARRSAAA